MANPQVNILGQDIFALGYIINEPAVSESRSFGNDKLINNEYQIQVRNEDNFFSVNNPTSIFSNINWLYTPIEVIDSRGEVIWNGIVTNIDRNHASKIAVIKSKNSLFKLRNEIIEYSSADWETGADAFKNVADNISFTNYDVSSVQTSINRLTDNNCYLKVNITKDDNVTFQQFIEKIAEYSNADAYSHNNNVYFVHWVEQEGGVSVNLSENDLKTLPIITEDEKEIINDYTIGYDQDNGTPSTDSNVNNIGDIARTRYGTKSLPEMRSDEGQIVFKDSVSAIYIGEGYIKRTVKNYDTNPQPLTRIGFSLPADHRDWIDLTSRFRLTLSDENWSLKIFEVFQFTINEKQDNISIGAYEVI